jgi:homoserine dehydrogenase
MKQKLTIGVFGFGCVGGGLYDVLNKSELIDARIKRIVVKNKHKIRSIGAENFSYNPDEILNDPTINVVAELIDDSDAAYHIVKRALNAGKHVVSANKKLIAEHLDELIAVAKANNVSFLYEAAVGGSIPIIRNLEEYYNNDWLSAVNGIINGTTNYILTRTDEGETYEEALKSAQKLGFAEADPTLDVEGFDSTYKLVILIKHAFGLTIDPEQIATIGITNLNPGIFSYARERGFRVKLLARAERVADQVFAVVAPHFVENNNFTYGVLNEFNAVSVKALFSDQQLFQGKGAGSHPTASAVLSDISALQFDYQYEYRKSDNVSFSLLDGDYQIRVLVSSEDSEQILNVNFTDEEERYFGKSSFYAVGWVDEIEFKRLRYNENLSLVLFNDHPRINETPELEFKKDKIENYE